jgi:MFS family permease
MGSTDKTKRMVSAVAATVVALAAGTNYAYSAWAPQFGERMKLSSTEVNFIGAAGNLGMYASGIPLGLLTDARGPRLTTLLGAITLGVGYYPVYSAYEHGEGSLGAVLLSFFVFLTGFGSCSAFSASIKTAASNFPDHRGTATAFPLAAFGLSAFFWSTVSTIAFKDDTGRFLLLLALGTFCLNIISIPFLRIMPPSGPYAPLSSSESRAESRPLRQTKSSEFSSHTGESDEADVRGLAMLAKVEFWQLFLTMALLSGLGLMTINNIGNSTKALWNHYDDSASAKFIQQRQVMHVSILSCGNFIGRLSSGIGSDLLVKKLNMSRFWCLFISAVVFTGTQLAGASIDNPNTLVLVSGLTGVAYGFLFGVFPSLVAHTFGIGGLSQNWGAMTMAPVLSGNIFNMLYGSIYDKHSVVGPDGERDCPDGLGCYQAAYYTTFFSGLAGIVVCLWSITREKRIHAHNKKVEHERLA